MKWQVRHSSFSKHSQQSCQSSHQQHLLKPWTSRLWQPLQPPHQCNRQKHRRQLKLWKSSNHLVQSNQQQQHHRPLHRQPRQHQQSKTQMQRHDRELCGNQTQQPLGANPKKKQTRKHQALRKTARLTYLTSQSQRGLLGRMLYILYKALNIRPNWGYTFGVWWVPGATSPLREVQKVLQIWQCVLPIK